MATYIGKCLYCEDGTVEYESKQVRGKKTKVYCCSNNKVTTLDDGDTWEPTSDSTCSWKLFGSNLERWGKKFIGPKEVKKLLAGDEVIAHMYSYTKKVEYKKYLTISEEYGVSVLWEMDVEEEDEHDETTEKKPYKKSYPKKEYSKKKKIEPEEEEIEYTPIVEPIKKDPVKNVFVKNRTAKKKSTESSFSKKDMDSLVLKKDTVNKIPSEPISHKQYVQEKTEKEFEKRAFVKPVFVNKKYTDVGAAF